MNLDWYPGQRVRCVKGFDDFRVGGVPVPVALVSLGDELTISEARACVFGLIWLKFREHLGPQIVSLPCGCCKVPVVIEYHAAHFVPLEPKGMKALRDLLAPSPVKILETSN